MAVNKVEINGETIIDLTNDSVNQNVLLSGYTAHSSDGQIINGALQLNTIYTGSSVPTVSFGVDGDLYLVTGV